MIRGSRKNVPSDEELLRICRMHTNLRAVGFYLGVKKSTLGRVIARLRLKGHHVIFDTESNIKDFNLKKFGGTGYVKDTDISDHVDGRPRIKKDKLLARLREVHGEPRFDL